MHHAKYVEPKQSLYGSEHFVVLTYQVLITRELVNSFSKYLKQHEICTAKIYLTNFTGNIIIRVSAENF